MPTTTGRQLPTTEFVETVKKEVVKKFVVMRGAFTQRVQLELSEKCNGREVRR